MFDDDHPSINQRRRFGQVERILRPFLRAHLGEAMRDGSADLDLLSIPPPAGLPVGEPQLGRASVWRVMLDIRGVTGASAPAGMKILTASCVYPQARL